MTWYEDEVHKLETTLLTSAPAPNRVAFYGSSSIRLWTTLAQDFPTINTVNLGFGGSTLAACAWFFDRLVVPAKPRSIVFYAGDNDLGDGRHPEEVYLFFCAFSEKMRNYLPGVPLTLLSIKISPARWPIAAQIRSTNKLLAQAIDRIPNSQVIDTTSPLLDANGRPRRELFEADGLHLSPRGYQLWRETLRPHLPVY